MNYSTRKERYRYTYWANTDNDSTSARQLYDLKADPNENKNIVELEGNQQLVQTLFQQLVAGCENAKPVLK